MYLFLISLGHVWKVLCFLRLLRFLHVQVLITELIIKRLFFSKVFFELCFFFFNNESKVFRKLLHKTSKKPKPTTWSVWGNTLDPGRFRLHPAPALTPFSLSVPLSNPDAGDEMSDTSVLLSFLSFSLHERKIVKQPGQVKIRCKTWKGNLWKMQMLLFLIINQGL